MAETASSVLVDTLIDWGVDTIFGLPGDGINGVMEALRVRQDKIKFVHVRHEEAAAFMACGYAKYTGKLGVCLSTSGPGGIHLLNGLYDAKLDGQPVLAITGSAFQDLTHTHTQQDVELDKLFIDVSVYNARIMSPEHVENVTTLACREALAKRGVTHITIASDIQEQPVQKKKRSMRNIAGHTSHVWAQSARLANEPDVQHAAEILNAGEKVVIFAGQGALHAGDELETMAELLGAPIIKSLLGKACVPDDSPYTTGGIGLLGTRPSQDAMESCDTLLLVGTCMPYIEFYPEPGKVKCIQIDLDPARIGLRYDAEIGLVGDSKAILNQLLPLLKRNENREFLEKAQKGMQSWMQLMEERGTRQDSPMKPQVVAWELGKRLAGTAIVSGDSGTNTTWWARQIPSKRGQMHSCSGTLASMAPGLPYAIAAQVAYPDRQCVAFVGDGGFTMLMGEFATAVKYNLPIKIVIVKNDSLGQIKWEQIVFLGNPEYGCDLNPIDFVKFAEACGGRGFRIDSAETCGSILDEALSTPGPVIIEAIVDPNEPPMPSKIEPGQALHFAEALAKGTPDRINIAVTAMKDRVRELL